MVPETGTGGGGAGLWFGRRRRRRDVGQSINDLINE